MIGDPTKFSRFDPLKPSDGPVFLLRSAMVLGCLIPLWWGVWSTTEIFGLVMVGHQANFSSFSGWRVEIQSMEKFGGGHCRLHHFDPKTF